MAGNIPLVLSKNKSWHQSGRGTATSTDDQEDIFQQRPRQETSTSRSLSSPMMTPNGFLDSCANIEHFSGPSNNKNVERIYPTAMLGLAESSGRDSDEDDDDGVDDEEEEEVEMVDHACQTRESLFDNNTSDLPPVEQTRQSLRSQAAQSRVNLPNDSRYKAERTIEIAQRSPQPLPSSAAAARMKFSKPSTTNSSSAASSKSGADVVVLH